VPYSAADRAVRKERRLKDIMYMTLYTSNCRDAASVCFPPVIAQEVGSQLNY